MWNFFNVTDIAKPWQESNLPNAGYDRFTDQTDKSADFAEFADYRYYRSHKPQYRIGIGSADYNGPYRLIGMGITKAQIGAKLVEKSALKH